MSERDDTTTKDEQHPDTIGPFVILDVLGEGGMAVVYLAEQREPVKRQVALKIIKLGMDSKQIVARFESERQALAVLDHPNIAKVFDGGITETGRPYFVMERVRGVPITDYCDDNKLSTRERIKLFLDVCAGVQHAHQKGLIHRDIKPSNILVAVTDGEPVVKIIDFGVAKATATPMTELTLYTKIGQIIGTPQYMSPEQAGVTGLDVDTRSDVYSLGVVLYELLVGALPTDVAAASDQAIRTALLESEPSKPSTRITNLGDTAGEVAKARGTDLNELRRELAGDLDWVVMQAIAKDRTRRYETTNALAMECRRDLNHEPVLAHPPSPGYLMRRFVQRNKTAVLAAVVALIAVLAGATAATIGFVRATNAERIAVREAETARQTSDFLVELFRVSDPSEARGNSIRAREILDRGADRIRMELGGEPQVQAAMMHTIGSVYASLGLFEESQPLLDDALGQSEALYGRHSAEVAEVLFEVAELARLRGNYQRAEDLHGEALAIRRDTLPASDPDLAHSLHGLGMARYYSGKYEEAEDALREALAIHEQHFDADAERAAVQSDLGSLYHTTGRNDEAEQAFEASLANFRGLYGDMHPQVASNLNDLGLVYDDAGRMDEARAALTESLSIFKQLYPDGHPFVAETQAQLAGVVAAAGEVQLAETLYRESLDMLEQSVGRQHMLTARVNDSLGVFLLQRGRYDDAEPVLALSVDLHKSLLGERHISTGRAINNMAAMLFLKGDYDRAEPFFRESLSIRVEQLGEDHHDVANSKNNLADLLNRLGNYAEAEPLAADAAAAYATLFNPDHWRAAVARSVRGRSLAGLGRFAEAEPLIVDSIDVIAAARGGSIYHRMALERAVQFYEGWNKPEQARGYEDQLSCIVDGTSC